MNFLFIFLIILIFFLAFFFLIFILGGLLPAFLGSSLVLSPSKKIKKGLSLLNLKKGEIFYDLGSGDGRVIIEAAKKYKVRAVGIELNPILVYLTRYKIRKSDLGNLAKVNFGNFFKENISDASAIFIYLSQKPAYRLEKKLLSELKKGTRILLYPSSFKKIPFFKSDPELPELKLYRIQ